MKISAFFVGEIHDHGFNASALAGVEVERSRGVHDIDVVTGVPYESDVMADRLAETAALSDMVIFVGGQGDSVTPAIAAGFSKTRFAVIQGSVQGPNVFSYEVCQEESAFLAGVFAAHFSTTGVVGHLSGHRVRPGLKGRAAFVAGARYAREDIRVLTSFCGTQDNSDVTQAWTAAQIENGADIIFTMLNGARHGAIAACHDYRVYQIGNALDWCAKNPAVFVASAIARIDTAVQWAIADAEAGIRPTKKTIFGLNDGNAVELAISDRISRDIHDKVSAAETLLRADEIIVPEDYEGEEYQPDIDP
ncbi:MAG: BMP family protein [Alphaproteobacteria bacterium]|nr:BMP family protein [Alphaproteobacteria bacterium]